MGNTQDKHTEMNTRKIRSIIPAAAFVVAALFGAASCDSDTLSSRLAKKALEREAMFRDSSQTVQLSVGFYETDSATLAKLQALTKEGVITCKVSEITEHRRFEKYTWWEGTKAYYKDVKHYFAEVSLTDEGRKYVVVNRPEKRLGEDDIPGVEEGNVVAVDTLNPDDEADDKDDASAVETAGAKEEKAAEATAETASSQGSQQYEAAMKRVKFTTTEMLAGFWRVERAFNVMCPENYRREGTGNCQFVARFEHVTPFGRIIDGRKEGERVSGRASLVHFLDKGWAVDHMDFGNSVM